MISQIFKTLKRYFVKPAPKPYLISVLSKPIGINKPNIVFKGEVKHCECSNCHTQWTRDTGTKPILNNTIIALYDYCTNCISITKVPYSKATKSQEYIIIDKKELVNYE